LFAIPAEIEIMGLFDRRKNDVEQPSGAVTVEEKSTPGGTPTPLTPVARSAADLPAQIDQDGNATTEEPGGKRRVTKLAVLLGSIASIGGFMFGYESGQISGMSCFIQNRDLPRVIV
jgi:SP family sugar:H+ symporter-like MFS transporter